MDFYKEANDLWSIDAIVDVDDPDGYQTIRWLRGFAARVLRDAVDENGKGWNLPEVKKIFDDWLELRAKSIEQGT